MRRLLMAFNHFVLGVGVVSLPFSNIEPCAFGQMTGMQPSPRLPLVIGEATSCPLALEASPYGQWYA